MKRRGVREINAPDWLTARPIAHRGLHAASKGRIENTLAAAAAASAKGYAVECDIQLAYDGEAMVFHDFTLDRLMRAEGRLEAFSAQRIASFAFKDCDQAIVPLTAFLADVDDKVPVIVEIKSRFDGDLRLAQRAVAVAADYRGRICLKSFDPSVLSWIRAADVACPLGLIAEAHYAKEDWPELTPETRTRLKDLRDYPAALPDFLSWRVGDLPHAVPELCRAGIGMPVIAWTVRSKADRASARQWADQIVFEGFEP
jgi:glycerophosphoryl diester phosphodiesterase